MLFLNFHVLCFWISAAWTVMIKLDFLSFLVTRVYVNQLN